MSQVKKWQQQQGFSIIEMMIAITIGLVILGALSAVAINNGKLTRTNDKSAELQSNGRYALDVLRRDIQHAGQSGLTSPSGLAQARTTGYFKTEADAAAAVTNDCAVGFALKLEEPIIGSNDTNAYAGTCIPAASYALGDIVAVRYADMTAFNATQNVAPTVAQIANGEIYFRSSYVNSGLYLQGGTASTILGSPMQDQLMNTYVYYISPNTTATDGIPALYRVALRAGAMAPELVVSGIENMQAQYGVVNAAGDTQYKNANVVTNAEWPLVKSVRIWLLARNGNAETGDNYSNTTSYVMGDVTYTPTVGANDKFRRQLYTTTVQLRNGG